MFESLRQAYVIRTKMYRSINRSMHKLLLNQDGGNNTDYSLNFFWLKIKNKNKNKVLR